MGVSCSCIPVKFKSSSKSLASLKSDLNIYYSKCEEIKDGLFDFDANLQNQEKKIEAELLTSEKTLSLGFKDHSQKAEQETEADNNNCMTVQITNENNQYVISPLLSNQKKTEDIKNALWRVIRRQPKEDLEQVQLDVHDILKLGKLYFHIREIFIPEKSFLPFFKSKALQAKKIEKETNETCRICLSKMESEVDPLISPCSCKGSMKYVHFRCLQRWVKARIEPSEDELIVIYCWKEIKCELCKTDLQLNFEIDHKLTHLFEIEEKKGPHLVFETIFPDEHQKLYVFTVMLEEEKEIIIGRYLECDVRINDITVSRFHSRIKMNQKKIYIEDLESKFGTLIMVQKPLTFSSQNALNLSFQCGNTILRLNKKQ